MAFPLTPPTLYIAFGGWLYSIKPLGFLGFMVFLVCAEEFGQLVSALLLRCPVRSRANEWLSAFISLDPVSP